MRLHLATRRAPESVLVLAGVAAALRIVLHWTPANGTYSVMFPLTVATAAASVVSVTTRSPLGEPERATGRWLPWLRLGTVLALTGAGCGAVGPFGGLAAIHGTAPPSGGIMTFHEITGHRESLTFPYYVLQFCQSI